MRVWTRVLATAAWLLFVVVGLSATAGESERPVEQAREWLPTSDQAGIPGPADEQGRYRYLVRFDASGALERYRAIRGTVEAFGINEPMSRALLTELEAELDHALAGIAALLGREIEATHRYLVTHSGAALWLHPAEARALLERPDVVSVERERIFELHTYRGPEFIGATADRVRITELVQRYGSSFRHETGPRGDDIITHGSHVFAFDGDGRARLLIQFSDSVEAILHDLRNLLAS